MRAIGVAVEGVALVKPAEPAAGDDLQWIGDVDPGGCIEAPLLHPVAVLPQEIAAEGGLGVLPGVRPRGIGDDEVVFPNAS